MLDRAEARARAVERWKAEGVNWRLPRVPELQRLFNKSAQPPGLDLTVFPAAPLDWHLDIDLRREVGAAKPIRLWQRDAEPHRQHGQPDVVFAWLGGEPAHGESRKDVSKDAKLPVRLVRPLPVEP